MTALTPAQVEQRVREHTQVARAYLVPEVRLRLITHDSPLWTATDEELKQLGWELPYWAFAWPGGQVLARYVLDHPELVRGRRVLDVGSGGALEAIACLQAGAAAVQCVDIDPVAELAARLNAELNGVVVQTSTRDPVGEAVDTDVILAGDVCYERALVKRMLPWLRRCAAEGATVLLGDPGRIEATRNGLDVIGEYDAPFDGDVRGTTLWKSWVATVRPM